MTTIHSQPYRPWFVVLLLAFAVLLAKGTWFSASAVIPALTTEWGLDDTSRAWLTMSVQLGFAFGAFGSAMLGLADRWSSHRFFTGSALLAATCTALIALFADGPALALPLRFLTGMALAGVYPVGMKIMATWTQRGRGLAIGVLVGALTIGSASPHLLNVLGGIGDWRRTLLLAAGLAALGGVMVAIAVREGPLRATTPRFSWSQVVEIVRERPVLLANLGYLGHMWELYAAWTWLPLFLLASFEASGVAAYWAGLAAFVAIGIGGIGCIVAGAFADRLGRTTITIASMAISSGCALVIGLTFGGHPWLVTAIALLWGLTVIADSAQFSAAISELSPPSLTGTALTLQTSLGFLLTLITIWLVPPLVNLVGWRWAFAGLAIGPVIGIWAMTTLRRSPAAARLAGGQR
ncbi:MAG: MFS transporter [Chloroflexus sp.]|uniref:MFS transporter n=1 Tax=Chloroflexus sp. TaxID=1904827 RepID=UPI0021DBD71A|nr:MFS transporter [Chloroflexus sp.]GIV90192.1 MAG: MFS transporter [Chloroflexus sp.]